MRVFSLSSSTNLQRRQTPLHVIISDSEEDPLTLKNLSRLLVKAGADIKAKDEVNLAFQLHY
jgi:hypothetical protein